MLASLGYLRLLAVKERQLPTRRIDREFAAIMALISAKTILTSLSFFHITLAFFFLTNPATIADQALVFVIGEAMGMVRPPFPAPQPS